MTGNGDDKWATVRINDWFLTLKVGALSHVLVSPFDTFGIHMMNNREQGGRMKLRIGTSWTHSAIDLTKRIEDEIVGKLDTNSYKSETRRIRSEIQDPTFGYLLRSSMGYQKKADALWINLIG